MLRWAGDSEGATARKVQAKNTSENIFYVPYALRRKEQQNKALTPSRKTRRNTIP